ncbi:MAG: leucine-rich repeat domain-containing protein [Oscillospiraceae bacterium]|nr:leucine-rich repeat domain-containing protein [Oscillospiraceae bacterium]
MSYWDREHLWECGGDHYDCLMKSKFADYVVSVTIPDTVKIIGDEMFIRGANLTQVEIPESVTRIGSWTFYDCSNLTSIIIPDSVTHIGERAFGGCKNLKSINIPKGLRIYPTIKFFHFRPI